jgi:hypothetical protein
MGKYGTYEVDKHTDCFLLGRLELSSALWGFYTKQTRINVYLLDKLHATDLTVI